MPGHLRTPGPGPAHLPRPPGHRIMPHPHPRVIMPRVGGGAACQRGERAGRRKEVQGRPGQQLSTALRPPSSPPSSPPAYACTPGGDRWRCLGPAAWLLGPVSAKKRAIPTRVPLRAPPRPPNFNVGVPARALVDCGSGCFFRSPRTLSHGTNIEAGGAGGGLLQRETVLGWLFFSH